MEVDSRIWEPDPAIMARIEKVVTEMPQSNQMRLNELTWPEALGEIREGTAFGKRLYEGFVETFRESDSAKQKTSDLRKNIMCS